MARPGADNGEPATITMNVDSNENATALNKLPRAMMGWDPFFVLTDYRRVVVAYASIGVFFGVQLTLFNNFVVERLGIEAHELGVVEAIREVPGFLNFVFLAMMIAMTPRLSASFMLIVMGVGIAAYAAIDSVETLVLFSLVWSVGFHAWLPLGQTMALLFSPEGAKGRALGFLRGVESLAWLATIGVTYFLLPYVGYGGMFIVAGIACVCGAVVISGASGRRPSGVDRSFVLKRKYALYYTLQFLQGWRKQMFITFAIFALVKVHGMPVETTIVLVFINQALIALTGPFFGRLVDRYGERLMLSISYVCLIGIFLGYGTIEHRPTLYALYCLDNLVFFGAIALTTYLHRVVDDGDLKPTLSMGVTWNHVASVLAPLIGGLAWQAFGYRVIFLSGAVIAAISLVVAQFIEPPGGARRN